MRLIAYKDTHMIGCTACKLTTFRRVAAPSCDCVKCSSRANSNEAKSFRRFHWERGSECLELLCVWLSSGLHTRDCSNRHVRVVSLFENSRWPRYGTQSKSVESWKALQRDCQPSAWNTMAS